MLALRQASDILGKLLPYLVRSVRNSLACTSLLLHKITLSARMHPTQLLGVLANCELHLGFPGLMKLKGQVEFVTDHPRDFALLSQQRANGNVCKGVNSVPYATGSFWAKKMDILLIFAAPCSLLKHWAARYQP